MSTKPQSDKQRREYEALLLLDRLHELREAMDELGITTLAELEAKIAALEASIDDDEPV